MHMSQIYSLPSQRQPVSLVIYNNMVIVFIMELLGVLAYTLFVFLNSRLFDFCMFELHVCYGLILFLLYT